MCRTSHIWSRKTFLKETILELKQAAVVQGWEAALQNTAGPQQGN
jgi:hypothetical protein